MYIHVHVFPRRSVSYLVYLYIEMVFLRSVFFWISRCKKVLFQHVASFFHLSFKNMYILGLVFGVFGGFITPAFSFILS